MKTTFKFEIGSSKISMGLSLRLQGRFGPLQRKFANHWVKRISLLLCTI